MTDKKRNELSSLCWSNTVLPGGQLLQIDPKADSTNIDLKASLQTSDCFNKGFLFYAAF